MGRAPENYLHNLIFSAMHWREASGKMTEVKHTRNIFFSFTVYFLIQVSRHAKNTQRALKKERARRSKFKDSSKF